MESSGRGGLESVNPALHEVVEAGLWRLHDLGHQEFDESVTGPVLVVFPSDSRLLAWVRARREPTLLFCASARVGTGDGSALVATFLSGSLCLERRSVALS